MSFFDQRYYALNKGHMSRIGMWPEQSKYVRNIWPLTIFTIVLSLVGPQMKVMLKKIEAHWKLFTSTSAIILLDKYTERGRVLTTIYSMYIYISTVFFLFVPTVPIILDFVDPLNETRPKDYIFEAEYGVDSDKYFWPILAHSYIVTILSIFMLVAADTMYVMWVEHACALFEIVGLKLTMTIAEYTADRKKSVTIHDDRNYEKICDCIILHKEAISFADMIESVYSGSLVVVIGVGTIVMSISGLQAMVHRKDPKVVLRSASFSIANAFHLYFNSLPGQKLIDHSLRVHNFAYDFDWYNMPLKAQKLLTLILIRSKTPCLLTAGKVYVLSMESYGSVVQTALSYFVIFSQLY